VAALAAYYGRHAAALSDLERERLETNPLRLLDSKEPSLGALNAAAPRSTDHLCAACADHLAGVRAHLDALGIGYRLEPTLVRGLDYYTRTAFEFYRRGAEGQQQALGGGGRYDGLVELLGGRPTPGIGFAIGLDRVVLALGSEPDAPRPEPGPLAVVVGADPSDTVGRLRIATELRAAGLPVRADLAVRKLGRQLEAAVREGARFAVILGDELAAGDVVLRDLGAASQKTVALADLAVLLRRKVSAG
jgi:histidyl-tRNA synthetase